MSKIYTTIQGDMWDMIAFKVYGNEYYMTELLHANQKYNDIVVFPAGISIICPEIDTATKKLIPPWKE